MRKVFLSSVVAFVMLSPALACNGGGNCENAPGHTKHEHGHNISGAPGPIAGAGLPVVAVGYGIYWLVKRRRKTTDV